MTDGFHYSRAIEKNPRTATGLEILKEAAGPMTVRDIQDESRRPGRYYQTNPATTISEIGRNTGYEVSDGRDFGQKPGPAVRFPDGNYRYWLKAAPGWSPRWKVTSDFRVVLVSWSDPATPAAHSQPEPEPASDLRCHGPECTNPVPADRARAGSLTCCDECFKRWLESRRPKNLQPQGSFNL